MDNARTYVVQVEAFDSTIIVLNKMHVVFSVIVCHGGREPDWIHIVTTVSRDKQVLYGLYMCGNSLLMGCAHFMILWAVRTT